MDLIWQKFTEWLKELLISGIMDNVNGLFDNVNSRVAGIAGQVGATPQGWNSGVYGMIRTLSDNVILPIAGVILAFVMTLELIQLITEKNNMHDVDTWMFFKWIFKTACAVLIVTNTWNIVMGVFEAAQSVVNSASGIIISDTSLTFNEHIAGFEAALAEMEVWSLLGLWLESVVVHLSMWALTICIFIICYAEIKALCAGDKRIKEKMDLDVDVARLKLMKASHQIQQFRLEDNLLRHFPEQIRQNESFVEGFTADMQTLAGHPHPVDGFAGMEVKGDLLTDKDNAGAAILEAFKDAKGMEPVPIGSYRGFAMSLTVEDFGRDFILTLKGKMNHRVTLGKDARGNLTRIDNILNAMPDRLQNVRNTLDALTAQMATAKAELGKPFPQEEELRTKSARLAELNAELNIDDRTPMEQMAEDAPAVQSAKAERPSVLAKLKAPLSQPCAEDKNKHRNKAER